MAARLRIALFVALAALVALPALAAAGAPSSTYRADRAYPHSRLFIRVFGHPKLHGVVTVGLSGSNAADDDIEYTLTVYVQPRSLFSSCPVSLVSERQNAINFPSRIGEIASGLSEGTSGRFADTIKYQAGGARQVVICAYTQWVTDDAAVSGLRYSFPASH